MSNGDVYMRSMLSLIARQTYPPERLLELVSPKKTKSMMQAYNLCDGTKTQGEVASAAKLDSGNFSRQVKRWVDEGIVIRIEEEGQTRLVHVYPLPDRLIQKQAGNDEQ